VAQSAADEGLDVGATEAVAEGATGDEGDAGAVVDGAGLDGVVGEAVAGRPLAVGDSWTTEPIQPARSVAHSQAAASGRRRSRMRSIVLIVPCDDGSCRRPCDAAAR
jgi:hypothetical protein